MSRFLGLPLLFVLSFNVLAVDKETAFQEERGNILKIRREWRKLGALSESEVGEVFKAIQQVGDGNAWGQYGVTMEDKEIGAAADKLRSHGFKRFEKLFNQPEKNADDDAAEQKEKWDPEKRETLVMRSLLGELITVALMAHETETFRELEDIKLPLLTLDAQMALYRAAQLKSEAIYQIIEKLNVARKKKMLELLKQVLTLSEENGQPEKLRLFVGRIHEDLKEALK